MAQLAALLARMEAQAGADLAEARAEIARLRDRLAQAEAERDRARERAAQAEREAREAGATVAWWTGRVVRCGGRGGRCCIGPSVEWTSPHRRPRGAGRKRSPRPRRRGLPRRRVVPHK